MSAALQHYSSRVLLDGEQQKLLPCTQREQGALKLGGPELMERGSRLGMGGPEQKLGSRARAGSASRKHQALSAQCHCRSPFSLIRSACA